MARKVCHITHNSNGRWDIKKESRRRASGHFNNENDAVQCGKELAKSGSLGQIKILRKDGLIQTEHTYGKDPRQIPKLRVYGPLGRPL